MKFSDKLPCIGAMTICLMAPAFSYAETGTNETLASFVSNYAKSDFGGTAITGGGSSGTITVVKSSGGPFVEGTSGLIQCIVFAKKSASGMDLEADCPAAFSSEDKIFYVSKRKAGDVVAGSSGEGVTEIVGGTGKFSGITGQCKYKVDYLEGNRIVSINKCQWQR